jgi:hypothetical protein
MKTVTIAVSVALGGLLWSAPAVHAQTPPTNTVSATTPALPAGLVEVVRLAQAKMSDSIILTKIKNDGLAGNLTTEQIIYLNQQGVSQDVIAALMQTAPAGNVPPSNATPPPVSTSAEPPPLDAGDQSPKTDDPIIAQGRGVIIHRSQLDRSMAPIIKAMEARANGNGVPERAKQLLEIHTLKRLIDVQLVLAQATDADRAAAPAENDRIQQQAKNLADANGGTPDHPEIPLTPWRKQQLMDLAICNLVVKRELGVDDLDASQSAKENRRLTQAYIRGLRQTADVEILDPTLKTVAPESGPTNP